MVVAFDLLEMQAATRTQKFAESSKVTGFRVFTWSRETCSIDTSPNNTKSMSGWIRSVVNSSHAPASHTLAAYIQLRFG